MDSVESIRQYLALGDRIGTAGQPTLEQLESVHRTGYQRVINLIPPDARAYLAEEPPLVAALGMEYVNIPVAWDAPSHELLHEFFARMDENGERKVFIHCVANKRVSAFLFLYRVLCLNMDEADAEDDMERIWTPAGVWRTFLEDALRARPTRAG